MLNYKAFNKDTFSDLGKGVVYVPTTIGVIGISKTPSPQTLIIKFVNIELPYIENGQEEYTVYIHLPTYLSKEVYGPNPNVSSFITGHALTIITAVVDGLSRHFGYIDVGTINILTSGCNLWKI